MAHANNGSGTMDPPTVQAVKDSVSEHASDLKDQAQDKAHEVADKALSTADDRKSDLTYQARNVVDSIGSVADNPQEQGLDKPAELVRTAVDAAERVITQFDSRDTRELLASANNAVRQQPLVFAGALLALGFATGRLLSAARDTGPGTYNNSEPAWPTLNNPAPYARSEDVQLMGSPYGATR
jgi:hypothetical protein